jgi:CRISPR system Cascade subunit CasB
MPEIPVDTSTSTGKQPPKQSLGQFIAKRVGTLQDGVIKNRAGAVGALAQLRRSLGTEIGEDPTVWRLVFDGFPERFQYGDEPTYEERAAHTAMCLFALHQQSHGTQMHRQGIGLGSAVRRLAQPPGEDAPQESIVRRFNALVTSDHAGEVQQHLRSLVGLFRANEISLDYGQLAEDLAGLDRNRRGQVQLRWSRDFSRIGKHNDDATNDSTVVEGDQT